MPQLISLKMIKVDAKLELLPLSLEFLDFNYNRACSSAGPASKKEHYFMHHIENLMVTELDIFRDVKNTSCDCAQCRVNGTGTLDVMN